MILSKKQQNWKTSYNFQTGRYWHWVKILYDSRHICSEQSNALKKIAFSCAAKAVYVLMLQGTKWLHGRASTLVRPAIYSTMAAVDLCIYSSSGFLLWGIIKPISYFVWNYIWPAILILAESAMRVIIKMTFKNKWWEEFLF